MWCEHCLLTFTKCANAANANGFIEFTGKCPSGYCQDPLDMITFPAAREFNDMLEQRMVTCRPCRRQIRRKDMAEHVQNECPVNCRLLGCHSEQLGLKALQEHESKLCAMTLHPCSSARCPYYGVSASVAEHVLSCKLVLAESKQAQLVKLTAEIDAARTSICLEVPRLLRNRLFVVVGAKIDWRHAASNRWYRAQVVNIDTASDIVYIQNISSSGSLIVDTTYAFPMQSHTFARWGTHTIGDINVQNAFYEMKTVPLLTHCPCKNLTDCYGIIPKVYESAAVST